MRYRLFILLGLLLAACSVESGTAETGTPAVAGRSTRSIAKTSGPDTSNAAVPVPYTPVVATEQVPEPSLSPTVSRPDANAPSTDAGTTEPSSSPEEEVEIAGTGGLILSGTFLPGSGPGPWPGVLLLHMAHGDRDNWSEFAPQLAGQGYGTLAIDLRGHGKTGGEMDWQQCVEDVRLVLEYLRNRPDIDPRRIVVIGASFGANLALVVAADDSMIRGVALLSPGLDYFGIKTEAAMENYGDRPVFIAVSREDDYSAQSSEKLVELAPGETQFELYEAAGHGTNMLAVAPGLPARLLNWLANLYQPE